MSFGRVELIRNGQVIATAASRVEDGHFRADLRVQVRMREPGWLALRTPSPFIEDQPQFRGPVVENELGRIAKVAVFGSEAERDRVLSVYDEAAAALEKRIGRAAAEPKTSVRH